MFNLDEEKEIPGIVPAVVALAKDPEAAKGKALKAREVARARQQAMVAELKKNLW